MLETPSYTLQIYGLSPQNGFLPQESPIQCLTHQYYEPWEVLVTELPYLISNDMVRARIHALPVLCTDYLMTEADWRRAYVVLSFLTHAYIWGGEVPAEILPPAISSPFLIVADHHGLPTTATYAGLNLWNFVPASPNADLTIPENVRILQTFTGTHDEAWFYLISVSIEAKGAEIIPTMLECFEAVRANNATEVAMCLRRISQCIDELGVILDRMHERCDPQVFYHKIRPFLAGSKGMITAGLPNGVFYDEGTGRGRWRQYSGGSNAQSSLIQLLDIMLGIEHYATGASRGQSTAPAVKAKQGYIQEMRNYMPGPHRHFLSRISDIANIREYSMDDSSDTEVHTVYQQAVESLTLFRDKHLRIVSRYIIAPSRQVFPTAPGKLLNIATSSMDSDGKDGCQRSQLSGTGGTALMPFLKQTRDETRDAAVAR